MDSLLSPKKKIILLRSKGDKKVQNKTATFGGCLVIQPPSSNDSQTINYPQSEYKNKLCLLSKLCVTMRFYQQLDVVQAFNLIKSRSQTLLKSQKYLQDKLKRKYMLKLISNLKSIKQPQSSIIDKQKFSQSSFQQQIIQNKYVKIQSYRQLQVRVQQLQLIIKQNINTKLANKQNNINKIKNKNKNKSKSKSINNILKQNRSHKLFKLDLPQISTDTSFSRVACNYCDIRSPLNRRYSINLDESNDQYSCLSFRTSKEKIRGKANSVIILKSKFVKGLY